VIPVCSGKVGGNASATPVAREARVGRRVPRRSGGMKTRRAACRSAQEQARGFGASLGGTRQGAPARTLAEPESVFSRLSSHFPGGRGSWDVFRPLRDVLQARAGFGGPPRIGAVA